MQSFTCTIFHHPAQFTSIHQPYAPACPQFGLDTAPQFFEDSVELGLGCNLTVAQPKLDLADRRFCAFAENLIEPIVGLLLGDCQGVTHAIP